MKTKTIVTAITGVAIAAGLLFATADMATAKERRDAYSLPQSAAYKQECSSCHFLYHPGLLPLRSWRELINTSDKHFGENLSLEAKDTEELLKYFIDNSADKSGTEFSRKIKGSIAGDATPVRITETAYIQRKHRKLKKDVFARPAIKSFSNCGACHTKGAEGDFEEDNVKVPK
jgi:cytochrome c553